jgi:RNA-binding protein
MRLTRAGDCLVLLQFGAMKLPDSHRKFLRGRGHSLKPVITVGDAGLSESLLKEFQSTILHHELVKVRVRAPDRIQRDKLIDDLCVRGSACLVSRIGNVALLYRPNERKPRIVLPTA